MSAQLDRVAEELEGRSLRPFWPKWRYIELYLGGKLEVAFGSFGSSEHGHVVSLNSIFGSWADEVLGVDEDCGLGDAEVEEVCYEYGLPVYGLVVLEYEETASVRWIRRSDADRVFAAVLARRVRMLMDAMPADIDGAA